MLQKQAKNIVLGAGYIFFDEFDPEGRPKGERYLAETPGFGLNITSENLEDWSSDGPIAEKLIDVAIRVNRTASLTLKDMSAENFAIFVIGEAARLATTSGSVTDAPINGGQPVQQGLWYQLGVSEAYPTGVRGLSAADITGGGAGNAYAEGEDYEIDIDLGRIYITPGGAIDNVVIVSNHTLTTVQWDQVTSNDLGAKRGALRFVAHNTKGKNSDLYLPDVVMRPDGDLAFKSRDAVQQMGFALGINQPGDGRAAVYLNGRAEA